MEKTDLGQTVNNIDSARLADKAKKVNPFLGKVAIETGEDKIPIPEGASIIRLRSGEVLFFSIPGSNNGYVPIPKEAKTVYFPMYRKHFGYIHYGDPTFSY